MGVGSAATVMAGRHIGAYAGVNLGVKRWLTLAVLMRQVLRLQGERAFPHVSHLRSHGRGHKFETCTAHQNKPRKSLICEAFYFSACDLLA